LLLVGPDDEAVEKLVQHFKGVIEGIVAGDWKHSSIGLPTNDATANARSWSKSIYNRHLTCFIKILAPSFNLQDTFVTHSTA